MHHSTKKPVTTTLTYPWKCTVLHCNHLGNTWKPLVLMTRHFDYCPSVSEGDNQSVSSSAPVVSRCFPGGYNVKLYISRGRLAWWLLAFLHSARDQCRTQPIYKYVFTHISSMSLVHAYVQVGWELLLLTHLYCFTLHILHCITQDKVWQPFFLFCSISCRTKIQHILLGARFV